VTSRRRTGADRPRLRRVARWLLPVALAVAGPWAGGSASGASPSPAPPDAADLAHVEAWLDAGIADLPPDAPAGGTFETGITFWDATRHDFAAVGGVHARLHPATGTARPTEASIEADRVGHVVIHVKVPKGGPGSLEVSAVADGHTVPLAIAGIGPPSGAAPEMLLTATTHPFVGDIVAGRAFPVAVDIGGWGEWGVDTLPVPDHLVAVVGTAAQPSIVIAELRQGTGVDPAYTGHLTIPDVGPATIDIAVPNAGGALAPIPGSTVAVSVIAGGRESPSSNAIAAPAPVAAGGQAPGPAGEIPVIVWIIAIGAVVVVLGALGLRRLGDL